MLSAVLLGTLPGLAVAAAPAVVDSGSYTIYHHDRALGTENFSFESRGDSLVISSHVFEPHLGPTASDTLEKHVTLVVKSDDHEIRSYESFQIFLGEKVSRGLNIEDTTYTSYLEVGDRGSGDVHARPPGQLYVTDTQVFVLYDVICRHLHGRTFETRPITMLALGIPDTMLSATATDLGIETIRWGARPVRARKLSISDADMQFFVWLSPQGNMLRLQQPEYGLRVEREPPAVKRRAPRPRGG